MKTDTVFLNCAVCNQHPKHDSESVWCPNKECPNYCNVYTHLGWNARVREILYTVLLREAASIIEDASQQMETDVMKIHKRERIWRKKVKDLIGDTGGEDDIKPLLFGNSKICQVCYNLGDMCTCKKTKEKE